MRKTIRLAAMSGLALTLGVKVTAAVGQEKNVGVQNKELGAIDLATEIEGMAGRQLRLREVTIAPEGSTAIHNHKDRPCIEFIIKGKVIEYRNGVAIEHNAGEYIFADKGTTHWWKNIGTTEVVLRPVDIFKP